MKRHTLDEVAVSLGFKGRQAWIAEFLIRRQVTRVDGIEELAAELE